jgi:hypothetical protein
MELEQAERTLSELNQPIWTVISSKGIEASGLTYDEAMAKMAKLLKTRDGLCIMSTVRK